MTDVDFSGLKRKSRLPAPPSQPSDNLSRPELVSAPNPPEPISEARPSDEAVSSRVSGGREGEDVDRPRPTKPPELPPAPQPLPATDGRARRATGRVYPFATRVASDFRPRLIALADRLNCTMAEALEHALEALETQMSNKR